MRRRVGSRPDKGAALQIRHRERNIVMKPHETLKLEKLLSEAAGHTSNTHICNSRIKNRYKQPADIYIRNSDFALLFCPLCWKYMGLICSSRYKQLVEL